MSVYIFGYGSLLNPMSRSRTFSEEQVIKDVLLFDYCRILNAGIPGHQDISMNIFPRKDSSVEGVLVRVSKKELPNLIKRELGYEMVEVTSGISISTQQPVYTFIMKQVDCRNKFIPQTYLDTCLGGVPEDKRDEWLKNTIIPHEIVDDRSEPIYPNYVPL